MIAIIAAVEMNAGIGTESGNIPWRLRSDRKRFRSLTNGKTVVVGRKTWETLPPLSNRKVIVLTHDPAYIANGAQVVNNVDAILEISAQEDIFIAGGGEIYRLFMQHADVIHLTKVHANFFCTVTMPPIYAREWETVRHEHCYQDQFDQFDSTYLEMERRR